MTGTAKALVLLVAALQAAAAAADTLMPQPVTERPAPAGLPEGSPPWPVRAEFVTPTERYPHGILGRIPGWGSLVVDVQLCSSCGLSPVRLRIDLPESRVFEDLAPRLWDITGDSRPEIVTVESDAALGARLVVWEAARIAGDKNPRLVVKASTPFIGTRFRWLAPVGAADFTGDGVAEIAYVEKPHLDRVLRLVTLQGDKLVEIARLEGVTNHAIGEERLHGGIQHCDDQPEIILQSGDRSDVAAIHYEEGALISRVLGPASDEEVWERALGCGP